MKKNLFVAAGAVALLASCGGPQTGITKGSLSEFDSLSYAMGINIGTSLNHELRDVPMDIDIVAAAVEEGALKKSEQEIKEASNYIINFMSKVRPERKKAIMERRRQEDSTRLANGDTTKLIRPEADPAMFENEAERKEFCEKLGVNMGGGLKQSNLDIRTVWVGEAIRNVWNKEMKMDAQQAGNYLRYYFMEKLPKLNAERSEKWLAEKASKSKAVKTESGLVYEVIEEGDLSQTVKSDRDTLKMHFVGRTMKGKVFGASHFADLDEQTQEMIKMYNPDHFDEDKPIAVTLKEVFPGWAEGIKFVGKGGKIRMWLPAELAFGTFGNRREVGANEAIEIEAELVDIVPFVLDPNSAEAVNAKASAEWLAEVEKQEGVKKTESGLCYKVERAGDEKIRPEKDTDRVRVHYEGTLRSGKVFDSSYERKEPITFALNRVIKGWTEGLKLVGKGGKITLWIPSELAYGDRGAGEDIGPNEALKFTVELLDVNPAEE